MAKQIILASSSPRRQKILKSRDINFSVIKPEVEEVFLQSAKETALENAQRKANEVFESHKAKIIIASDTVVSLDDKVLGKPKDMQEAKSTLTMLSGRSHEVLTAVSIKSSTKQSTFYEVSKVLFKKLSNKDIENYFKHCNPLDKAGSYNIDEFGNLIIEAIEGSYENIMGLPIERFLKELSNHS